MQRMTRAVTILRQEFAQPLPVERLAVAAGMSASSFHEHFRSVTSLSPRQFQKQLRLIEARRLMMSEGATASSAAFASAIKACHNSPGNMAACLARHRRAMPRQTGVGRRVRRKFSAFTLILHIIAKESSQIASRLGANAHDILTRVHLGRADCALFATPRTHIAKIAPRPKKVVAAGVQRTYLRSCPISHVPVVVCQSVGIRTRGRTAAKGRRSRGSLANLLRDLSLPEILREASISLQGCLDEGDFALCNRDWQPEANRRTPLSTGDAT